MNTKDDHNSKGAHIQRESDSAKINYLIVLNNNAKINAKKLSEENDFEKMWKKFHVAICQNDWRKGNHAFGKPRKAGAGVLKLRTCLPRKKREKQEQHLTPAQRLRGETTECAAGAGGCLGA